MNSRSFRQLVGAGEAALRRPAMLVGEHRRVIHFAMPL